MVSPLPRARLVRVVVIAGVLLGLMLESCHAQGEGAAGEQGEAAPAGEGGGGGEGAAAEGGKKEPPPNPTSLRQCKGLPTPAQQLNWFRFADPGKWYVTHVSSPLGRFRGIAGFAMYLKQENIIEWRTSPLEVEEIFVKPASRPPCVRVTWDCVLKGRTLGKAACTSILPGFTSKQDWFVLAYDLRTTAVVFSVLSYNQQSYRKVYLLSRQIGGSPNPRTVSQAMHAWCGVHAANPNSQFYTRLRSGSRYRCILA